MKSLFEKNFRSITLAFFELINFASFHLFSIIFLFTEFGFQIHFHYFDNLNACYLFLTSSVIAK